MPVTYTDFSPIALLVTGSYYALTVAADSPLKSAKDFMELLKKNPSAVAVGLGSAAGASHHIALGLAMLSAGVEVGKVKTVSFNESSSLLTALLGGHVAVGMATAINVAPHVESGKLRVLAISAPRRISGALASVPTWTEQGYKGTWESWRGVIGTKGTIASGVYQSKLIALGLVVWAQACPMFVHLVEEGLSDSSEAEVLARHYLSSMPEIDTLILGCTHYPVLAPVIQRVAGAGVTLVSSAEVTAEVVARAFMNSPDGTGRVTHYVTGGVPAYQHTAGVIGGVDGQVIPLDATRLADAGVIAG